MNVWLGKHPWLIVAHLTLATILWATVVYAAGPPARGAGGRPATIAGLRSDRHPGGRPPDDMESATNTGDLMPAPRSTARPSTARHRSTRRAPAPGSRRPLGAVLGDYLALTKPRIISLLLVTTVATMFVADPSGPAIATILWTILGGYLAAGGAGAINHYLERDRDARMARTCAPAAGRGADRAAPRARSSGSRSARSRRSSSRSP